MGVFLSTSMKKPLLVEGPAGAGKTHLAQTMAKAQNIELIRLQCYEGIDESRALYEWEYGKQLLYTQLLREQVDALSLKSLSIDDAIEKLSKEGGAFFSQHFLSPRPLLRALLNENPCVLLVDEIDKADPEFEAFLLEFLAEMQVTIPELGTLRAKSTPQVVLTSNRSRALSAPLKRRALHLWLDVPSREQERKIIAQRFPKLDEALCEKIVFALAELRKLELMRTPSLSEGLDWAKALLLMGEQTLTRKSFQQTLGVLIKEREDHTRVYDALDTILQKMHKA